MNIILTSLELFIKRGRIALTVAENFGEVCGRGKADLVCDLCYGFVAVQKHFFGGIEADFIEMIGKRHSNTALEKTAKIGLV